MRDLTVAEQAVIDHLATAWNLFIQLPPVHSSDAPEFCHAIHAAQNIVWARPAIEQQSPEQAKVKQ